MKRLKRFFSLVISTAMVVSLLTVNSYGAMFTDVNGHWAQTAIEGLAKKGIVSGMGDGAFAPNANVTRAQFATMINKAFGFHAESDKSFSDVSSSAWYASQMNIAVTAGYIAGYEGNLVRPDNKITRAEAAQIAFKASGVEENSGASNKFTDASAIPTWARPAVDATVAGGIFKGDDNNKFNPTKNLTRAEASVIVTQLMMKASGNEIAPTAPTTVSEKDVTVTGTTFGAMDGQEQVVEGNLTIVNPKTTVANVIVNGDLIIAKSVGDGDVTLQNVTVKGMTSILGGGVNSIHISKSNLGKVTVGKADGNVRIVVEVGSKVDTVTFQSGGKLENKGTVGTVTISKDIPTASSVAIVGNIDVVSVLAKITLALTGGTVNQMTVSADAKGTTISTDSTTVITLANINAAVSVTGKGTISQADISVAGVTVEKQPASLTSGSQPATTPGSGGGGGGGNSSSSGGNGGTTNPATYTSSASYLSSTDSTYVVIKVSPATATVTSVTVNGIAAVKQADPNTDEWRVVLAGNIATTSLVVVMN